MGIFDNFKINFNIGDNNKHRPMRQHHDHGPNHHELEMVREGRGVFAWIEKSGMFYSGDIPGVSGIMRVNMKHSFEECFDELSKNINNSISASFSSFKQDVSYEEIANEYPEAEIIFIPIYKK